MVGVWTIEGEVASQFLVRASACQLDSNMAANLAVMSVGTC